MLHYFINLWHAARPVPQPGSPPTVFVGMVKRVPASVLAGLLDGSESLWRMNREWDEIPASVVRDLAKQGWAIVAEGDTEQIEALDGETGDLLVMWRAPCTRVPV